MDSALLEGMINAGATGVLGLIFLFFAWNQSKHMKSTMDFLQAQITSQDNRMDSMLTNTNKHLSEHTSIVKELVQKLEERHTILDRYLDDQQKRLDNIERTLATR